MSNKEIFTQERYQLSELYKIANWLQEHPNAKELAKVQGQIQKELPTQADKAPNPRRDY
jgi:transcriptional regulator of heat shock response